jgi:hypothetical protein
MAVSCRAASRPGQIAVLCNVLGINRNVSLDMNIDYNVVQAVGN